MELDVLIGFCAGAIDNNTRLEIHRDRHQGYYGELEFFELTSYSRFLENEMETHELMGEVAGVLMSYDELYYFDRDNGLICFDKRLAKWSFE